MENNWFELIGIVFFTFMVLTVALIWALAVKASYNQEKEKLKNDKK